MDPVHEGDGLGRLDHDHLAAATVLIESIAGGLRAEFGVAIDAHPGGAHAEAGAVNRALLAVAGKALGIVVSPSDDPAAVLNWALRRAARRRLDELGVSGPQAEAMLVMEPALGDRWLAYLTLAPEGVIADLLGWTP